MLQRAACVAVCCNAFLYTYQVALEHCCIHTLTHIVTRTHKQSVVVYISSSFGVDFHCLLLLRAAVCCVCYSALQYKLQCAACVTVRCSINLKYLWCRLPLLVHTVSVFRARVPPMVQCVAVCCSELQ